MSTFNGVMVEFPDIRVDNFRRNDKHPPPLACFLSHVHSDHLAGLENVQSSFIYCSQATRQILLAIERRPHRINYQKSILESRELQYKHLKKLLKPIPLETPTKIELSLGRDIQVTLFDANHCVGAVMFLIESDSNAVLYTGDIRSEPWFVNAIARNPCLIEYTTGSRILDTIYLDTTNIGPNIFPSKSDGIKELLRKVEQYPPDTTFHFKAWTYGYEDVWIALSKALKSRVHLDSYKLRLYQALAGADLRDADSLPSSQYGPVLVGYKCANSIKEGILTSDESVRIHSCEQEICSGLRHHVVWIRSIVRRGTEGDIPDKGVGGGGANLCERPELALESVSDKRMIESLDDFEPSFAEDGMTTSLDALKYRQHSLSTDDLEHFNKQENSSFGDLSEPLTQVISKSQEETHSFWEMEDTDAVLPKAITFPYSRHSSYYELVDLVKCFSPKDVFPCVVRPEKWNAGITIDYLFGPHCSGRKFRYDIEKRESDHQTDSIWLTPAVEFQNMEALERPTASSQLSFSIDSDDISQLLLMAEHGPRVSYREQLRTLHEAISPIKMQGGMKRSFVDAVRNDEVNPKRLRLNIDSTTLLETHEDNELLGNLHHSVFDAQDQVFRCSSCSWEMWTPAGNCSNCDAGFIPYYEVINAESSDLKHDKYPGIVPSIEYSDDDVDEETRVLLTGEYLDGASAYDPEDDEDFPSYKEDSFVRDSSSAEETIDELSEEEGDENSLSHKEDSAGAEELASLGEDVEWLLEQRALLGPDFYDNTSGNEDDSDGSRSLS